MKERNANQCQSAGKTQTSAIVKYFCSGWGFNFEWLGWKGDLDHQGVATDQKEETWRVLVESGCSKEAAGCAVSSSQKQHIDTRTRVTVRPEGC